MRLARVVFPTQNAATAVVDVDGHWVTLAALGLGDTDIESVLPQLTEIASARERVDVERAVAAGDALPDDDVRFASPLTRTRKVLAMGLNYRDHVREIGAEIPKKPLLFGKLPNTVTGPYDDVVLDPALTDQGDYEVELAAVIGRQVRNAPAGSGLDAVAGYAVSNDLSSRDLQLTEGQWIRSKSFDGFCPVGPWITSADAVADPHALDLSTHVNGELRQKSNTGEMIFSVAELVEFVSQGITLEPGDLILTGTPPGVALGMEGTPWLRPGDVVRCEIESLGYIENTLTLPTS